MVSEIYFVCPECNVRVYPEELAEGEYSDNCCPYCGEDLTEYQQETVR